MDDEKFIFFEPMVLNFGNSGFTDSPGGEDYKNRSVLAYHTYCCMPFY